MPAYLIVLRASPVRNAEAYDEYVRKNRENPPVEALKPLVVYGAIEALEGEAPDGMVMLQFDTVEDAKAWYERPGYQAAVPHRLRSADWIAFIVEGV